MKGFWNMRSRNENFIGFFRQSTGGRPSIDHAIKIDMAKND